MKVKTAVPTLLKAVQELENASSTREQAAAALGRVGDKSVLKEIAEIAEEYPELMTRRALLNSARQISDR